MKYIIFLCIFSVTTILPTAFNQVAISSLYQQEIPSCALIFQRFYYIARLDETFKVFTQLERHKKRFAQLYAYATNFETIPHLEHPQIQRLHSELVEAASLEPLLRIWQEVSSYKYLQDARYIEDFTKCIVSITRNAIFPFVIESERKKITDDLFSSALEELLNVNDTFVDICEKLLHHSNKLMLSLPANYHLTQTIRKDDVDDYVKKVSFRLYFLKRFERVINVVSRFCLASENIFATTSLQHIPFVHARIKNIATKIDQEKKIDAALKLWDELKQFRHAEDKLLLREFVILVTLIAHEQVSSCQGPTSLRAVSIQQLAQMYVQLQELPLEEILNATDLLIEQMPGIIEDYELNSDLTWKAWFKKYWWAPPLVIISLIVRIMLNQKAVVPH